jgi:tetratricopeptide (TPR) repeat protein
MGKCYELTGCAVSARLAYEEGAVRFAESRVLREALAGLYVSQGMPLLAVRIYEGLIRRFPGDASLLRNLAQAHLACHEPDRAIPWLEMAHRLSPEDTSICQMLADLYLARRMNREASEAYRLLLALTEKPTAEDHFRLAHAYFQSDELVSAKEALDRAIALDPSHAPSCLYLGHVARRQGRTADAALLYEKAIALSPGLRAAHLALANLFLQQKDYGRAAHYYREGLQEDGADPTTLRNAIIALFRSGDPSGSASLLRDASRKYPGHPDLRDLWLLFPARPRTPGTPVDPTASGSSEEDRPRPAGGIPRPP